MHKQSLETPKLKLNRGAYLTWLLNLASTHKKKNRVRVRVRILHEESDFYENSYLVHISCLKNIIFYKLELTHMAREENIFNL